MEKYDKLSMRGGASKGLLYFRILKEIYNKNLIFKKLSGVSAGGIFTACLACVRNPKRIYEIMLSIRGDKVMKWACEAEKGKTHSGKKVNMFKRIIKGIGLLVAKRIPYNSIKKTFKKHLSWNRLKKNGVEFLAIGVVKQKDLIRVVGKQFFTEIKADGFRDILDNDGLDDVKLPSKDIIHKIPIYFFTNKGTYKKEYGKKPVLINKRPQPLWKVVLATFSNPILPSVRLKFDRKYKEKCFDAGVANNYGNTIWEDNEFHQISCGQIPGEVTGEELGINGTNVLYYNENRGKSEIVVDGQTSFKGFFGFYDANIEDYYKEEPTNFFEPK